MVEVEEILPLDYEGARKTWKDNKHHDLPPEVQGALWLLDYIQQKIGQPGPSLQLVVTWWDDRTRKAGMSWRGDAGVLSLEVDRHWCVSYFQRLHSRWATGKLLDNLNYGPMVLGLLRSTSGEKLTITDDAG